MMLSFDVIEIVFMIFLRQSLIYTMIYTISSLLLRLALSKLMIYF